MTITLTTNYEFKKGDLGHPERDTFTAANLDMIDAAILAGVSPLTAAKIIVGSAENLAVGVVMSGDITIGNTGVTAIGADKVEIANLEAALKKDITMFGEVDITETTVWKLEFPFKVTINKVNTIVSVALSAHETTVTLKNNGGTSMTNGIITIASGAAKGDVDTASPTEHNVINAGEDLQLVSSGACSTGKAVAIIHYTRTA